MRYTTIETVALERERLVETSILIERLEEALQLAGTLMGKIRDHQGRSVSLINKKDSYDGAAR